METPNRAQREEQKALIHFGDITKLNGADLPLVDVITGGSPSQDLSIAGERKGLAGERSGLFMEQIRIVKEMRENDRRNTGRSGWHIRPRYMVWENVPGAFSSNKGADFGAVLTEIARIAEPEAPDVLMPENGWPHCGCIYSEVGAWSIAWRVHDAQFWGVPQRRKRIALVADFGGLSAPEVLFERKGLRWDPEPGEPQGQGAAKGAAGGAGDTISFQERAGKPGGWKGILIQTEHVGALSTLNNQAVVSEQTFDVRFTSDGTKNARGHCYASDIARSLDATSPDPDSNHGGIAVVDPVYCVDQGGGKSACNIMKNLSPTLATTHYGEPAVLSVNGGDVEREAVCVLNDQGGSAMDVSEDVTASLRAQEHGHQPLVYDARGNGNGDVAPTLTGDHQNRVTDYTAVVCIGNGQVDQLGISDKVGALNCMHDQQAVITVETFGLDRASFNQGKNAQFDFTILSEKEPTMVSRGPNAVMHNVVRRLTPTECERLQGFLDGWTDIGSWTDSKGKLHKKSSDTARYKALGNSIAIPFWFYLLRRIAAQYERPATLGSLFDGIGGFPLCWERCNGKGTALWASEIEEFPIAVTKRRFPNE